VVTRRELPPGCAATGVDRNLWRQQGALALRRTAAGWDIEAARPPGAARPWTGVVAQSGGGATSSATIAPATGTRDATPRGEDLDFGD